jgi:hypothetical protein
MNGRLKNYGAGRLRVPLILEMKFEEKTYPKDDQGGAKYKRKCYSQKKSHCTAVVLRSVLASENRLRGIAVLQHGAIHFDVSANPELDFSPGLPKQIESCAGNEHADDSEQRRQS